MSKSNRSYRQGTLKKLFALSGNQCAYPRCEFPVIWPATETSDDIIINDICHIYSISEDGPRGKSGLTNKELNSPKNLILFCRNHHGIVDGQHETYPAEKLKKWKREHEKKIKKYPESVSPDSLSRLRFLTELVDREIEKEVDTLRKSRFFKEFDSESVSLKLANDLMEGKFCWGTDAVRSRALAWCVRIFQRTEELDKTEEYLAIAKNLETCDEVKIAEAFVLSRKKKKNDALKILAGIDSSMSRSAAFMIVSHHEGLPGAVDWLSSAGVDPESLDSDGKYYLLAFQLELGNWDEARASLGVLSDEDLRQASPALHYMMAATHLSMAVPEELRAILIKRPPLEEVEFHLDSDAEAIRERRKACGCFAKASKLAEELNCSDAAKVCEEYALWLKLADPEKSGEGEQQLEEKLCSPKAHLHLVRLAARFRINFDPKAIELEIDRWTYMSSALDSYRIGIPPGHATRPERSTGLKDYLPAAKILNEIKPRIKELSRLALEEGLEGQSPLSDDSHGGLVCFLNEIVGLGLDPVPGLTLTYEGNLKAKWRSSPDERLALEFVSPRRLKFLFFHPDPLSPDKTHRTSGSWSVEDFLDSHPRALDFLRGLGNARSFSRSYRHSSEERP